MIASSVDVEPLVVSVGKNVYGGIMYLCLQRQSLPSVYEKVPERFNDQLNILIPAEISKEGRFVFDPHRVSFIDKMLRGIFDEKLLEFLMENCQQKGDVRHYCIQFLNKYDITEDEISLYALEKSFQRFRRANGIMDKKRFRSKVTMHRTPRDTDYSQISLKL
jgi:hypothetical protein